MNPSLSLRTSSSLVDSQLLVMSRMSLMPSLKTNQYPRSVNARKEYQAILICVGYSVLDPTPVHCTSQVGEHERWIKDPRVHVQGRITAGNKAAKASLATLDLPDVVVIRLLQELNSNTELVILGPNLATEVSKYACRPDDVAASAEPESEADIIQWQMPEHAITEAKIQPAAFTATSVTPEPYSDNSTLERHRRQR